MPASTDRTEKPASPAVLAVSALGIVFGDIGTSPLYTFKTVLNLSGGIPAAADVYGVLSLIVWTLLMITMVKYVTVAMSISNDGEGGILALMSLLARKRSQGAIIIALGLLGAALIYGDGAITPAISVLSALEGLHIALPSLHRFVLPAAVIVLVLLFVLQPLGTARIGRAFGPIMALWFATLAALGVWGIVQHPGVLRAVDPLYALQYLRRHGFDSLLVLGGVFLCVTGAEALYADMGHFGARPVRFAWSVIVFPSLLLNYAGQAAIVLQGAPTDDNIFYRLCPPALLLPLIALATVATIIASQAIVTGAFSMTRQAIQLGWLPRLRIRQTSETGYGQIYVGAVNWMLLAVTVALTVAFRKSDNLASAYGIAVSLTMLMTTTLLYIAMRDVWKWSVWLAVPVAGLFFCIDATFVAANMLKIADGGFVPLILAATVYAAMLIWHRGSGVVARQVTGKLIPVHEFFEELKQRRIPRVPGTAVFITRTARDTPPVMKWHVRQNRALHRKLLALTIVTESAPRVHEEQRLCVTELAPDFWRVTARYGFMERPNVPELVRRTPALGCELELNDVTYYVGIETIIAREDEVGLTHWEHTLFAAMSRNAAHVSDFFRLPSDNVVELGRQIPL